MNKHIIIGNLTQDPASGTTPEGVNYCKFTVAVNRNRRDGGADYIRVTAWRGLAENCQKYLRKGRKVCCVGPSVPYGWQGNDGSIRAQIQMDATEVEFLSSRGDADAAPAEQEETAGAAADPQGGTAQGAADPQSGMTRVETDDLPF